MRVFHGSSAKIRQIDLSKCETGKDFGQGFYVTKIKKQADFWAERRSLHNATTGFVTEFEFDEYGWEDTELKVLRFDQYNEEWLNFVVKNREKKTKGNIHDYDIVEGPVADDRIARRITKFLRGSIPKEDFLNDLIHSEPTHQICFCTFRSLQMLELIDHNPTEKIEDINEAIIQTLIVNEGISTEEACDRYYISDTYRKLEDLATDLYLKPWEDIYELLIKEQDSIL